MSDTDRCREEFWQDALDGTPSGDAAAHLSRCEECAQRERALRSAIATTRADLPPVPQGLEHRVLQAVDRERSPADPGRGALRLWRRASRITGLPRVAMLCLGIVLGVLVTVCLAGGPRGPGVTGAMASDNFLRTCSAEPEGRPAGGQGAHGPKRRTVTVAGVWAGHEAEHFEAVLRRFARSTGARVNYVFKTRDMAGTIRARLLRDCPPDIAMLPQPSLLAELVDRKALAPIDDIAGDLLAANYTPAWRRMAEVRHRSYGVWFKAANKSNLWYSKAALRRAGVDAPTTWKELQGVAGRLARRSPGGVAPFAVAGEDGWTLTDWFENVYLATAGPGRYARLARGEIAFTHPTVKRALRALGEIFAKPQWFAGRTPAALRTSYEESVHSVFGSAPTAAMMSEGDFVLNEVPGPFVRDVGVVPFPSLGRSRRALVVGGDVAVLFAKHEPNPVARELMRYLASPAAAEPWIQAGGFISPNRHIDQQTYPNSMTRRLARALVTTDSVLYDLSDLLPPAFGARDGQGMWETLRRFLAHPSRVDEIAAELQRGATTAAKCEAANAGDC